MKFVKVLLLMLGLLMIMMGALWIGQGLNIITWPAESFMIGKAQWSWNGSMLFVLGAVILWWASRK